MREFFRGWRRKVGIATLLMSCVFAVGWVRSFDRFEWYPRTFPNQIRIVSANGCIRAEQMIWEVGVHRGKWYEHYLDQRNLPQGIENDEDPMEGQQVLWRVTFPGFHCGSGLTWGGRGRTARVHSCVIHYWSIALPLTLLSAWLLLRNNRPST